MVLSVFVPIAYLAALVISMSIFSRVYRRRTAAHLAANHAPWFPEGHPERDIYQSLVLASANPPLDEQGNARGQIPETVLKAALLNRAMADVKRIIRMRDDKQAMAALVQKGSLGDETVARFALAEKELEAELLDVISEANTFREGWGQLIFPTAGEMVAHLKHKEVYYGVAAQRDDEKRKLQEAGKPVPQSRVPLPPLVTPPGTQIQVQMPAQPGPANGHAAPANNEQAKIAAAAQAAGLPPGFLQAAQAAAALKQQKQASGATKSGSKQVTMEEEVSV